MRALIPGLESPHPFGLAMPAVYQEEDEFGQRWLSAFDEVLAPVLCTLDNLERYFEPELAPDDFVSWLGLWVGLSLDENWDAARRRQLVEQAAELYRWRGTRKGLSEHIAVYTGVAPEIVDSGGTTWSETPGGQPPGDATPMITIRVHEADGVDVDRLDQLVAAAKPAHVLHRIEVVGAAAAQPAGTEQ